MFMNIDVIYDGNGVGSNGLWLQNADNNTFLQIMLLGDTGPIGGCAVRFSQSTANTTFPKENVFINVAAIDRDSPTDDNVCGTSGTGGNLFLPFPNDDGQSVPVIPNVRGIDYDGAWFGKFAVVGQQDEVQFRIGSTAGQTASVVVIENSSGGNLLSVEQTGRLTVSESVRLGISDHNNLPTGTLDGSMIYCSNCVEGVTSCTPGGAGTMAFRLNGAWKCF